MSSTPPAAVTPLPYKQIIPLVFVLLNEMICMGMLFPIVGFLVAKLRGVTVEESGYMSGILLGVMMLGQIASAKTWGHLSDVYGRRFPLISGLLTSGFAVLFFGLSTNFWLCAFFRFCQGLFNGNVLVAKTMIADITDKSNQAKGFALAGFTYGIGLIIGPAMGGLLYDPVNHMPSLHLSPDGIFASCPALLPSLVIFVYSMVGMVVCTVFLKESNQKAKPLPRFVKYIYPCFWKETEFFVPPEAEVVQERQETNADDDDDPRRAVEAEETERPDAVRSPTSISVVVANEDEDSRFGYQQAFQHPETRFMLLLYMIFAGGDTLVNETFPLWCIASVSVGGFGFRSDQVGFLLLANGIPCLLSTVVFPMVFARYTDKAGLFRFAVVVVAGSVFVLPLTYYLPHGWVAVTLLLICQFTRQLVANWCFALCTMLTARSAPEKYVGAVMGISQSVSAMTRACVPFIFTPLFAWSISGNHMFPFNHCLTFLIGSGSAVACWFRMYMVSCNPEGKINVLEGGIAATFQRLVAGVKQYFSGYTIQDAVSPNSSSTSPARRQS